MKIIIDNLGMITANKIRNCIKITIMNQNLFKKNIPYSIYRFEHFILTLYIEKLLNKKEYIELE